MNENKEEPKVAETAEQQSEQCAEKVEPMPCPASIERAHVPDGREMIYFHVDVGDYSIKVSNTGRIEFIPKKENTVLNFNDMKMPGLNFWESMSELIAGLNHQVTAVKGQLAIEKVANELLERETEGVRRKYVFVGSNKKQAFFAGLQFGRNSNANP